MSAASVLPLPVTGSFLDALWPKPQGILSAYTLPSKQTFCADTVEGLMAAVSKSIATQNVYVRATSLKSAPQAGKRGVASDSYAMPGVWADIDILGPAHKAQDLPPDLQAALDIANCTELKPSLIVHSGNGIQAWWVFKEPVVFEDDGIQAAAELVQRWQAILAAHATKSGHRIDATHDLARVMRLPGTFNRKDSNNPKPITFTDSGLRFNPSDFAEIVKTVKVSQPQTTQRSKPTTKTDFPLVAIEPIMAGCSWMRHCQDDAATLPEPEWHQMLTVVARCEDGDKLAHDLSSSYPGYSKHETTKKLAHVKANSKGPVTCAYVETSLGFDGCQSCANNRLVKSPISIGSLSPRLVKGSKSWKDRLYRKDQTLKQMAAGELGKALANHANIMIALEHAPGPSPEFDRQVARPVQSENHENESENHEKQERPQTEGREDWKRLLLRGKPNKNTGEPGGIKPCTYNVDIALRNAPEWAGALQFDEFSQRVRLVRDTPLGGIVPRDVSDAHMMNISIWMQGEGLFVGHEMVGAVADAVAMDHAFHPLRDWLNGLEWDGVPRLDSWLSAYMGAAGGSYTSKAGRWWMISAVARVMKPGCQADHMLIMEGPQGRGKSTALRILAGDEYFTDQLPDLHSKDASLQLFGKWIIEWGELETMGRSQVESVKTFVSRRVETLRRPYGKITVDVPRQCVFGGSTNDSEYLRDSTGGRRFWPFFVGSIDLEALKRDRDQLWAEAVGLYREGAIWWPDSEEWIKEAAVEASLRVEGDVWADSIKKFTAGRSEVKPDEVLFALGISLKDMKPVDHARVCRCLRILGFDTTRTRGQGRFWVRKPV